MVKVSVVIPVYNSKNYLRNTLNSVVNQTLDDFEAICVNDGSTDGSLEILNEFSQKYDFIHIINQENSGPGAARNNGLRNCQGDYIYFLDSDDEIAPELLELVYNNAINNDSDLVFFKINIIKGNKKYPRDYNYKFEKIFKDADFDNFHFDYKSAKRYVLNFSFAPWAKLYKKDLLTSKDYFFFDEELPYEDVLFHIKVMLNAKRISYVPKYLYYYRVDNVNSVTFDYLNHFEIFDVIDDIESFLKSENHLEEFQKEFEFFKFSQILRHMTFPIDENYFNKAHLYLDGIDVENNNVIPKSFKRIYATFFDSENADEFEEKYKIQVLVENNRKLKKSNKKLMKKNKKLKKELKQQKNIKKGILSSNSWKFTKILRKIKNN